MECQDIRWMLALYDSGELSAEEKEITEAHLATCEKCRQELARLSQVPEMMQSLQGETWWADVSSAVKKQISTDGAEPSKVKRERRTIGMPIWQRALAGVFALAIMAVTSLAIIRPWEVTDITQLAVDTAQNSSQVQALIGEGTPDIIAEQVDGAVLVKFTTMEAIVSATVDTENGRISAIQRQALVFLPPGMPVDRPELTQEEKGEALAIAQADSNIQVFLSHGFTLGEPNSTHPVLGDDARRVAWLPLEGADDDYIGAIVNLDDHEDITIIWNGELPAWWPFVQ